MPGGSLDRATLRISTDADENTVDGRTENVSVSRQNAGSQKILRELRRQWEWGHIKTSKRAMWSVPGAPQSI